MRRCDWVTNDPIYIQYHDLEWGVPVHDETKLFEMLLLEGAQAGLSWITVLKRRESYKVAYNGFDPIKISKWNTKKINNLLNDPGIIRNKLKVNSAVINAKCFLKVLDEYPSFDEFIWSFVAGNTIHNSWDTIDEIPITTAESDKMSKELKRRGFKFVGSTICYAYMQAVGMVNDHLKSCFRYEPIKNYMH